jgi:two-component system chemotaxis sensor kinase CheA
MPDMDGFQFAEAVRASAATAHLPVIALSSVVSPDTVARGRSAGFHDFVAKFDRQGLIAALQEQTQQAAEDAGQAA